MCCVARRYIDGQTVTLELFMSDTVGAIKARLGVSCRYFASVLPTLRHLLLLLVVAYHTWHMLLLLPFWLVV